MSALLSRLLAVLAVALLCGACPSSHEPSDPRPPCPEGDDVDWGNACATNDDCEPSFCGRLAGVCVDNTWTCGQCGLCFFTQIEHIEDTYLACNLDTGRCGD